MKKIAVLIFSFFISAVLSISYSQPTFNQWDNFEDGTRENWTTGAPNPLPPVNISDGGPAGDGDNYLLASSNGSQGAGGRLVIYNTTQWAGDFTSAGITAISMHLNNFGATDLLLRLAFRGPGGDFWSLNAVPLPAGSGWITVTFSIQSFDLVGGSNVASTLAAVNTLRLLHSVNGAWAGDRITAQLGIDNITAAGQPLPVELVSFSASIIKGEAVLKWETSSEKNNFGFEIERKCDDKNWITAGFIRGKGTTTETSFYSFTDDLQNNASKITSYRLKQIDFNGDFSYSNSVEVSNFHPSEFELGQNYPNPFNPSTLIAFKVKEPSKTTIKIFDVLGNEVKTLVNERKEAGDYSASWDGNNSLGEKAGAGVYFYKMEAGNFLQIKKMILLK